MKTKWIILAVIILCLFSSPGSGQSEGHFEGNIDGNIDGKIDNIFEEICSRGFKGYKKFAEYYFGNRKKEFWRQFYDMVRNFGRKEENVKLLECREFWDYFRDDNLFYRDSEGRQSKEIVESILTNAVTAFKDDVRNRMAWLEPLEQMNLSQGKMRRYTGSDSLGKIVAVYINSYRRIQEKIVPKTYDDVKDSIRLLEQMDKDVSIKQQLKTQVLEYLQEWKKYYKNEADWGSSAKSQFKAIARISKLKKIQHLGKQITAFNISRYGKEIRKMEDVAENEYRKLKANREIEDSISRFEKSSDFSIGSVYQFRREIMNLLRDIKIEFEPIIGSFSESEDEIMGLLRNAGIKPGLSNRIVDFRDMPDEEELSFHTLGKYLTPRWTKDRKEIKIFKEQFKHLFAQRLQEKLEAGGKTLSEATKLSDLEKSYFDYFQTHSRWNGCIEILQKYYLAKDFEDNNRISKLQETDVFSRNIDKCSKVWKQWRILDKKGRYNTPYSKKRKSDGSKAVESSAEWHDRTLKELQDRHFSRQNRMSDSDKELLAFLDMMEMYIKDPGAVKNPDVKRFLSDIANMEYFSRVKCMKLWVKYSDHISIRIDNDLCRFFYLVYRQPIGESWREEAKGIIEFLVEDWVQEKLLSIYKTATIR